MSFRPRGGGVSVSASARQVAVMGEGNSDTRNAPAALLAGQRPLPSGPQAAGPQAGRKPLCPHKRRQRRGQRAAGGEVTAENQTESDTARIAAPPPGASHRAAIIEASAIFQLRAARRALPSDRRPQALASTPRALLCVDAADSQSYLRPEASSATSAVPCPAAGFDFMRHLSGTHGAVPFNQQKARRGRQRLPALPVRPPSPAGGRPSPSPVPVLRRPAVPGPTATP